MPNVGTITGSMVLDPSAYISGLNRAAGATNMFQQGVSSISFAGFNRGMIASTTLMYTMGRVMSSMSKGMEEYSNILGRIGTVADLTAASVAALADSMRQLSVAQGVSRKDIMGGMYVAAQAGYGTPAEMRSMATSGAKLSRASGKEIDVKKSVDLMSGIRQALGVGAGAVSSNRMSDILLKGRDIGRWELDQMAHALGIPLTVWGNQFAGKQSGEETLRELLSVMSVASLAGVSPNMTATGTRRIVEKTLQLNKSGKVGDPLRNALRGAGFNGQEPILDALNQGGMKYLNTLMGITGDGQTSELTRLGYGSRDLLVLTSAMRGKGEKLNQTYQELSYGNTGGTTERYNERMKGTYDYSRDRLRAQWEITSQQFMQASIPLIGRFTEMLGGLNTVAQALPESVKSFILLIGAMTAFRYAMNLVGFRTGGGGGGVAAGAGGFGRALGAGGGGLVYQNGGQILRRGSEATDTAAARQARRAAAASGRASSYSAGFAPGSGQWVGTAGMPWGSSHVPFKPMAWNEVPFSNRALDDARGIGMLGGGGGNSFGPRWYKSPRGEPMNYYQAENMRATSAKLDAARAISNSAYWAPDGSRLPYTLKRQFGPSYDREMLMMNTAAMGRKYLPSNLSGRDLTPGARMTPYGPTVEQRIRWAAYKQGQSVGMASGGLTGEYGSMSSAAAAYGSRSVPVAPPSVSVWNRMQNELQNRQDVIASNRYAQGRYSDAPTQWQGFRGGLGEIRAGIGEGVSGMFSRKTGGAPSASFGSAMPAITSFGSAISSAIGPLVRFSAILWTAGKVMEGWAYKGRGGTVKEGGKGTWKRGDGGPGLLSTIGHGYNLAGSFFGNGFKYLGDMAEDYADKMGYVADSSGRGSGLASYFGLNGYRQANANDAMGKLARENLTPGMVRKLSKGGIDFGNFDTAKPYVSQYMTEQLDKNRPGDWNEWFRGDMQGSLQIVEDAMKFYADVITRNAKSLEAQTVGARWSSPWRASVSDMTTNALVEGQMLSGRQWDIYSASDPFRKNGGLNWGAGGRDYRGMYGTALGKLDSEYGGFAADSYSAGIRRAIAGQNKMWKGRAAGMPGGHMQSSSGSSEWWTKAGAKKQNLVPGAAFGGVDVDPALDMMLQKGDRDYGRARRLRSFMDVMPDIGTMPEADAAGWFAKLTGRSPGSDVFADANFKNFRNMDLSQFISTQTGNPTQYASATQFGSAEAYNELLQRDKPEERISIAVDKLANYIDTLVTKQEDVDSELARATKGAAKFFEQADATGFFLNVQDIADNGGGD